MTDVDAQPVRFSLIIPARNEEDYLPRLLDTVDEARARYAGGPEAVEVIVADNVSTDGTAKIARERGCRVARVEKRVIAAVRNGGTTVARGQVLAFVDADMRIHPDTFKAIACVRKFDKHGDWHYLTDMPRLLFRLLFMRGSLDVFVQAY